MLGTLSNRLAKLENTIGSQKEEVHLIIPREGETAEQAEEKYKSNHGELSGTVIMVEFVSPKQVGE